MINFINILLGGALLFAGRKLFWLFVGAIGFVTGLQLASSFWQGPENVAIIFGLVLGVIFALLAVFLQTIAIGIAGFFAGGFALISLAGMFGIDTGSIFWIIYVIGGIIGLVVVIYLFDWAIITLSSVAGASLLVQAFIPQSGAGTGGVIFLILVIIGVVVQGSVLRSEQSVRT